jgi:hypothetical protein
MPPVKTHAIPACCRTNLWSPGSSGCTTSPGSSARTCLHCRVVVIVLLLVLLVVMNMMVMIMMVVATPCLFLLLATLLTHANRQTDRQTDNGEPQQHAPVPHARRTFDRLGASSSRLSLSLSSSSSSWCLAAGAPPAFFRFLPPPCCQWCTERTVRKHGPQPTMRTSCCIMLHRRRTFDFLGA